MDKSQSEELLRNATTENIEVIKESIQGIESPTECAKAEYKDFKSTEFAEEIMNVENLLTKKNVEILKEVIQQEASNEVKDSEEYAEENVEAVQKQTIEILKVEVVAPKRDDFGDISEVGVNSENNSDADIVENADHKQVQNEADPEIAKADTNEVNAAPMMAEHPQLANISNNIGNGIEPSSTSGLGLLAQYQSDDDTESVVEVPLTAAQDYRNQVVEIDSDSDSDDSSSSSADVEYLNELRKTIEKRVEIADDDGEDEDQEDGTGKKRHNQKLKVKGELTLEDLPPIQDLKITVPENDCIEFGKIHSIVDQLVLVSTLPNSILLDLETVIFLEKGQKVLGEVFDVLGQVADPLYCVRFNSNKQIKEKQIEVGDVVYVAPKTQYTQYVILSNLMKTKGSDASWENDVEPPPRFLDYSDDEQEQLARKQLRNKDRPNDNDDANKRPRTVDNDSIPASSSYHPTSQHRNRYEYRNSRGSPAGQINIRPRYNGPHQTQQRIPNHHRSSWHSNYNPQNFTTQPSSNFRMHLPQNQSQSFQAYQSNMAAYGMPNAHSMTSQPESYAVPPMYHQHPQLLPNTLNMRPSTFYTHHQYNSNPPPPPGSQ